MGVTGGVVPIWNSCKWSDKPLCPLFFRPAGARVSYPPTHSLRCGLHSCAAPRLKAILGLV